MLKRRDALLYVLASGIGSFGLGVTAFYLNFLYRALGFGDAQIGALAAAVAIGALIGAAPASLMARRLSRRAAILIGGTVTAVGIIGIVFSDQFAPLVVASIFLGSGGIIVSSSGGALIADATRAGERASMFGRQIAVGTITVFFASFVAGALATPVGILLGLPPQTALVIRVLIASGGLIAIASVIPILLVAAPPVPRGGHDAPRHRRLLGRFVIVDVCFGFGAGSFLPFVNLFFAERHGLSLAGVGLALGVLAAAGSLGAVLNARYIAPRFGLINGVVGAVLVSVLFALLAAVSPIVALAIFALGARALVMYGVSATFSSFILSSFSPAERAGANAIISVAWSGGFAVAAYLSGLVRAASGDAGYGLNLATLAAGYTVAALLILVLFRRHEPAGDAFAVTASDSRS